MDCPWTCFGATADAYFNRAADFAEQINATGSVSFRSEYRQPLFHLTQFDRHSIKLFGAGAARYRQLPGRDAQRKIGELVIALAGDVAGSARIGDVILAASAGRRDAPVALSRNPRTDPLIAVTPDARR